MRRILMLQESGVLTADGPAGSALVRRLEGALLALVAMQPRARGSAKLRIPRDPHLRK